MIKEYSRKQENAGMRGFDVPLGKGDIDWPAVRQALLEIDYRGWATAEVRAGDREYLADLGRRMNKVLDV